jgi:hypothetical protein
MSTLNVNNINDASGNDLQYICKAWVNFNGTGTVAIRDDFNVDSITDNGAGDYTINFTTVFANNNYTAIGTSGESGTGASNAALDFKRDTYSNVFTTSSLRVNSINRPSTAVDRPILCVVCFGNQ